MRLIHRYGLLIRPARVCTFPVFPKDGWRSGSLWALLGQAYFRGLRVGKLQVLTLGCLQWSRVSVSPFLPLIVPYPLTYRGRAIDSKHEQNVSDHS